MKQFFVVIGTDRPGMREVREQIRPTHRAYLRAPEPHPVSVRLGGPLLEPEGGRMNGTLLVVAAESIEDVEKFVRGDPYSQANLFEHVAILPWSWTLGNPERSA